MATTMTIPTVIAMMILLLEERPLLVSAVTSSKVFNKEKSIVFPPLTYRKKACEFTFFGLIFAASVNGLNAELGKKVALK